MFLGKNTIIKNSTLMETYSSGSPFFLKMLPNCIKTYCYGFRAKIPSWRTVHASRKCNSGDPRSHELAEQTEISERKIIENYFRSSKLRFF